MRVPGAASLRYAPDRMELEGLSRALGGITGARFSDASGRERMGVDLSLASGVTIVECGSATLVVSDALFAVSDVACRCGADALVDVHELYKRTHGGAAPARLLRGLGLGRGLRGRCRCGERLDPEKLHGSSGMEAPFARFAVLGIERDETAALERALGFGLREVRR